MYSRCFLFNICTPRKIPDLVKLSSVLVIIMVTISDVIVFNMYMYIYTIIHPLFFWRYIYIYPSILLSTFALIVFFNIAYHVVSVISLDFSVWSHLYFTFLRYSWVWNFIFKSLEFYRNLKMLLHYQYPQLLVSNNENSAILILILLYRNMSFSLDTFFKFSFFPGFENFSFLTLPIWQEKLSLHVTCAWGFCRKGERESVYWVLENVNIITTHVFNIPPLSSETPTTFVHCLFSTCWNMCCAGL